MSVAKKSYDNPKIKPLLTHVHIKGKVSPHPISSSKFTAHKLFFFIKKIHHMPTRTSNFNEKGKFINV